MRPSLRSSVAERQSLVVVLFPLLLALHGCAGARPVTDRRAAPSDMERASTLALQVDSLRRSLRIPGLAIVVLRDTTVLLARGFGYADVERRIPVTAATPFNVASVSKPISAVVALRLVESGRLDLDRPMRSFAGFTEFCEAARGEGGIFFRDLACDARLTLRHVLSMQANGEAGSRFLYNPPSFSWASRPMAEVSGVPFSTLVDSLVFRRAGMRESARTHRRLPLRQDLAARLARPYHLQGDSVVPSNPPPPQGDGAAGGVTASAADLARFDVALSRGLLLTPASIDRMWTPGRSAAGAELPYGLGWFVQTLRGERVVYHTGLWEGAYSALYLKVPARGLTLVLLANSEGLRWQSGLDEAAVERSPFASAFFELFMR